MSSVQSVSGASVGAVAEVGDAAEVSGSEGASVLPECPPVVAEDYVVALAMMAIDQKRSERANADRQRTASEKAQEEAHADKIEKMTELAEDTFMQGLVEGVLEGLSASAGVVSAVHGYVGAINNSKGFECASKIEDAAAKGFMMKSRIGGSLAKSAQEEDRRDIAVADAAIDRAKKAVDAAGASRSQAQDDIKETMNAIRGYLAAKTQLGQSAIIRG